MINELRFNWLIVVFIALAVQGCSSMGGLLEERHYTFNFKDGSTVKLVRFGCNLQEAEVQTANGRISTEIIIVSADDSKQTVGQWEFRCGSTVDGGRSSCERVYDHLSLDPMYQGGFGCPTFDQHNHFEVRID